MLKRYLQLRRWDSEIHLKLYEFGPISCTARNEDFRRRSNSNLASVRVTFILQSRNSIIQKPPKNELGYTHRDYEGKISTLCAGCGHDNSCLVIEACYDLSIEPHRWRRFPASAAPRKRRTISSATRTASTRCTAGCRRC